MQFIQDKEHRRANLFNASSSLARFPIMMVCSLLTVGCASVTGTTNQNVSVQAREPSGKEVKGASCELTNNKGKWFLTTPGSVGIHRSNDELQVTCTRDDLEPGRLAVVSGTKGSMWGNIILGGGIGAIIDHNNGTAYEYPSFIQVVMGAFSRTEPTKPSSGADENVTGYAK
jgi:hypothetical protein